MKPLDVSAPNCDETGRIRANQGNNANVLSLVREHVRKWRRTIRDATKRLCILTLRANQELRLANAQRADCRMIGLVYKGLAHLRVDGGEGALAFVTRMDRVRGNQIGLAQVAFDVVVVSHTLQQL